MPAEDPGGKLMEMIASAGDPGNWDAGPMEAVSLLTGGQKLENLLNHLEDLKGTPFEGAYSYLSEKFPHVFGNVRRITSDQGRMQFTNAGQFMNNPAHPAARVARKGLPVGDIHLNPDAAGKWFGSDPVEALAHEGTHAAQSLGSGPQRFEALYDLETIDAGGYLPNKYEVSARKIGKKHKKLARKQPKK